MSLLKVGKSTAQKMKFSIKDFFSKCDQNIIYEGVKSTNNY